MQEQTFFMIKPDGVKRGLVGKVLGRLENRDFRIEDLQMRMITRELLEAHYADLVDKSFFEGIATFMMSGPVVTGIASGPDVIKSWRTMMGVTDPVLALPGTIRGDFARAQENGAIQNIVHGSDSPESARREIQIWFGK
ncbi:nucleoside-diphosphate kinase [Pseudolactococcus insecticola]|uniref:Nucleoside diphosphate kinase n=1 Tax=Pseudolactococcus insecticola TaxID=2709158 RepID=A0A6A0B8V5_9LACT|nr:nucleoside-diphosphate kinase [Lactococcus insecticola]GFH40881.1 nucleoside diphosphate kinase [Lactococcus insecticola]